MERRSQRILGIGDILGSRQTKEQRRYYKRLKKKTQKGKPKENEATEDFQRGMINNVKYCRVSHENEPKSLKIPGTISHLGKPSSSMVEREDF